MTFKKLFRILPAFMLAGMLALTGCQAQGTDIETGSDVSTEATEDPVVGEGEGDTEELTRGEYEDKVFDPALTKGKFAVYVFRADQGYVYDAGTQHSGDSMLILTPDGKTMLIDTNSPSNSSIVVDSLHRLGIEKLDYLVFSHSHLDHVGGYSIVLRYMNVGEIFMNAHEYWGSTTYADLRATAEKYNVPVTYKYEGDTMKLGEYVDIKFLNPPADYDYAGGTSGQNSGSLLLKVVYNESSFLFGGDLYADREAILLEKFAAELDVDVAKMNHHGDKTSNTKEWIAAVSPKIAFTQMSGVFSDTIMGRYRVQGALALHTALDGPFVIYTEGDGTYDIQASQDRWVLDYGDLGTEKGHVRVE